MKNILNLTKFLSLVLIKQKATMFFVILSLIGIGISFLFIKTNIGIEYKLFKDLVLSMNSLFLHFISVFLTFLLLEKFKQGSISVIPLSLNIKREQYILSLFLTMIVSTLPIFLSFFIIDLAVLEILQTSKISEFLLQVLFYYMSSILLSYIIMTAFFGLYNNTIKSITVGLITFMMGNSLDELVYFYENTKSEATKKMIDAVTYIFPNFSLFDIQTYVVNSIDKNFVRIGIESTLYFIMLSIILIIISVISFRKTKVIPNDS